MGRNSRFRQCLNKFIIQGLKTFTVEMETEAAEIQSLPATSVLPQAPESLISMFFVSRPECVYVWMVNGARLRFISGLICLKIRK
jgi:hypothetical protein